MPAKIQKATSCFHRVNSIVASHCISIDEPTSLKGFAWRLFWQCGCDRGKLKNVICQHQGFWFHRRSIHGPATIASCMQCSIVFHPPPSIMLSACAADFILPAFIYTYVHFPLQLSRHCSFLAAYVPTSRTLTRMSMPIQRPKRHVNKTNGRLTLFCFPAQLYAHPMRSRLDSTRLDSTRLDSVGGRRTPDEQNGRLLAPRRSSPRCNDMKMR